MTRNLAIAVFVLAACKGDQERAPAQAPPAPAVKKIDGPSVTPSIGSSVTFVVPKAAAWWGELSFSCYRAVMSLTGTRSAREAFEKISPNVPPAMAAGGIDLGRDLAGIGMFECGGSPCIYVAATLPKPDKMNEVLGLLVPGMAVAQVGSGHYTIDTPSSSGGTRVIHVRVVPIAWTTPAPRDPWSQEAARATHVVFLGGVDGKNVDVDPVTLLADAPTAAANVKEAESVLADANNRCLAGLVGTRDFQPGFQLERARFAMAAPRAATSDALMTMLGSQKTLAVDVELVLSPAPSAADAKGWITLGKMFMRGIGENVRAQFAGQGEMMEVYFDMLALIGVEAFTHAVKDRSLRLSWRTDRIPAKDLNALEARLQRVMQP